LEPLVARPWFTGRTSAAALVRKVDKFAPTLLLDESDAAFGGDKDYSEALRAILNSGYRRSGRATVCVGQGANIDAKDFKTFCAKAIAGIGTLPDTIADRCIPIALRRRKTDEPCERWRERAGHQQAGPLRSRVATWGKQSVEVLREARPAVPSSLSDRQADCWEPLVAVADLAGGPWPSRARNAALALAASMEDADIVVELLQDVKGILTEHTDPIILPTKVLLEKLVEQDERPWSTWSKGKPITAHKLARLLGPLGLHPISIRTARGYRIDAFEEAFSRYLSTTPSPPDPSDPGFKVSQCHNVNENGPETPFSKCHSEDVGDTLKTQETPINTGLCDTVTLSKGGRGDLPGLDDSDAGFVFDPAMAFLPDEDGDG
jgi:hypothetical protein